MPTFKILVWPIANAGGLHYCFVVFAFVVTYFSFHILDKDTVMLHFGSWHQISQSKVQVKVKTYTQGMCF